MSTASSNAVRSISNVSATSDLDVINAQLKHATAQETVRWAHETFGSALALSSSFGADSAVMLHLATQVAPDIMVIFVDTGYLFPETYRFAEELRERLKLNLKVVQPALSAAHQEALYGRLWEQGETGMQRYQRLNKVEPMERALRELGIAAWISGVRANQTEFRSRLRTVEEHEGRIKIHPILHWAGQDIDAYLREHNLPRHPLYQRGYRSIGDVHSTIPTLEGQDPREGRLLGKYRECGLHLAKSA